MRSETAARILDDCQPAKTLMDELKTSCGETIKCYFPTVSTNTDALTTALQVMDLFEAKMRVLER